MERKHTNAEHTLHDKMDTHLKRHRPQSAPKGEHWAGVAT